MNKSSLLKWKIPASLACLLLLFASSAPAQLTVTSTDQYGTANTYPFTPTWTPATDSLLLNVAPSTVGAGNFTQEIAGRNPATLTQGGSLTISKTSGTTSINYVTCGGSGGQSLIYTMATNAYGYNLTNISIYGGWADNGRDAQGFTLWYSTVADPTNWIELTTVNYIPAGPGSTPTSTRTVINDASGALIAANVAQLKFDFTTPVPGAQDNGYVGEAAITAEGSAAPTPITFSITTQTQEGPTNFTPTYVLESNSLIANENPSTATGNFAYEDTACNVNTLTQGGSLTISQVTGNAGDSIGTGTTSPNYVTCGGRTGLGSIIIYQLTNSPYGSDLTNIVVYNGWKDGGRMGQYYIVSYSTVAAPNNFTAITTINYLPADPTSVAVANRVAITAANGAPIVKGAAAIKFDFVDPYNAANFNNGFQGYAQIIVQGTNSATPPPPPSPFLVQDTLPNYATTIVGDSITFTATYSNTPPVNVQWQDVSGGVTNTFSSGVVNVTNSGVVSSTLTVNNLQVSSSGFYRLAGFNATNGAAAPSYSTEAQLVVNPVPAAVGNIIMYYAEQDGLGPVGAVNTVTNFYPSWTVNTVNDLVDGFVTNATSGIQGTSFGTGNFDVTVTAFSPTGPGPCSQNAGALSDGAGGYITYWPNVGGNVTECSCGTTAGTTLTFTLPAAGTYGYDITNISVYGGWGDAGRNEQKYEILYSTALAPTNFTSLGTFDYNPSDPHGVDCASRTMLIPVSGVLFKNAYAVEINWNVSVAPKNNWEGYSEVVIQGTPSHQSPVLVQNTLPSFASTTVGDSISFSASYGNTPTASLQWQVVQNGVTSNIPGATASTLTLSNLQVTNTGYYQLQAINTSDSLGISVSSPSLLVVSNVPAPVSGIITTVAEQDGLGPNAPSTNFIPTWVENTASDLILGSVDGAFGTPGDLTFGNGTYNLQPQCSIDPVILSDGSIGYLTYWPGVEANATECTLGVFHTDYAHSAGLSLTYTLPSSSAGWSLTNITVYGGWGGADHDEQKYQVLYSTVANPSVFINLTSVDFLPGNSNGWQAATRTMLTPASPTGILAQNVYAVEFFFNNQGAPPENIWEGYSEFVVAGVASPNVPILTQDVTPATAEDVVGSSLIIEANFSGASSFQWYKDGTNLPGATSATLTLTNLQLTDVATNGGYKLVAINGAGTNVSSACTVVIDPAPVATNNVITAWAYQTSAAGGFGPTWDTSALSSSLIIGQNPPSGGVGTGSFVGGADAAEGLQALTDGTYWVFANDGTHPAFAAAGPNAGTYVIYTLGSSSTGYTITNIQIAGGWNDNGRDSQYYTVSYSTVANPTTFTSLVAVQNNLGGYGVSDETTVRGTFTAANGVLAVDAYAIKVDFTTPAGVPNGYSGYSEISVFGSPTPAVVLPPVVSSPSVSGGNLIMTGTGGTPFAPYILITTTNLLTPLANWTTNTTGTLDVNGAFSNAIPINPSLPASFFTVKLQ